ncbi:helix-turn-helix domain-containing protein [Micromonospora sp. LOL_023]|uniref:helix-turn-helix domain-containing protein n=1 Tax=Micromonospora sp. LOL_023 TaxID=3345418 RepID=UPI003A89CC79
MAVSGDDLLTTGEAAVVLRMSRRQVVDRCVRGQLPYVWVGRRRRLRRADVEAVLQPSLIRDQYKALWLHHAVAGRLVADPDLVLQKAASNLERLRAIHPDGMTRHWLDRWAEVLTGGTEVVLETLTSRSALADELRQNSPFAGVLTEAERQSVLRSFADR